MGAEKREGYLKFIAYLQIIGIILVVAGHSLHEYPDGKFGHTLTFYQLFQTFRMPLFLFVSGYLMVYTTTMRHHSWSDFARSKLKRLLLPFLVLTLVTFVPRSLLSPIADDPIPLTPEALTRSIFYEDCLIIPFLWFLRASFILLVFCYGVIVLCRKGNVPPLLYYVALVVLFIGLPFTGIGFGGFFSLDKVVRLGIYFVLGAFYCQFAATIDRIFKWCSPWILLLFALLWVVLFTVQDQWISRFLCSLCGICMCISLTKMMEAHGIRVLDHLMGANYLIFLLSWYCNILCQHVLHHFTDFPWWVYSILSLVAGVYVPWLGYRYLQRHPRSRWVRITAYLLGQKLPKR